MDEISEKEVSDSIEDVPKLEGSLSSDWVDD